MVPLELLCAQVLVDLVVLHLWVVNAYLHEQTVYAVTTYPA